MHPFQQSITRRWSPSELPFLPFLAPRLLQSWAAKPPRTHSKRADDDYAHKIPLTGRGPRAKRTHRVLDRLYTSIGQPKYRTTLLAGSRSQPGRARWSSYGDSTLHLSRGTTRQFSGQHSAESKGDGTEANDGTKQFQACSSEDPDGFRTESSVEPVTSTIHEEYTSAEKSRGSEGHAISSSAALKNRDIAYLNCTTKSQRLENRLERHRKRALRDKYRFWAEKNEIPQILTKYVKLRPNEVHDFGFELQWWTTRFAIIHKHHEQALAGHPNMDLLENHSSKFSSAVKLLFVKQNNVASLASFWKRIPEDTRRHVWAELMLTTMSQYPDSTLKLMVATYQEPLPPSWAASDCVNFITSYYLGSGSASRNHSRELFTERDFRNILHSIQYLVYRGIQLSQRSVTLLQIVMTDKELKTFYLVLEDADHHLTTNVLSWFAYHFARSEETDLAFRVLERATIQGFNLSNGRWPEICAVLLTKRYRHPEAKVSETQLFEFMLNHGYVPDITTYNVLIQNSLANGDNETGWRIFDMVVENGIKPDLHTYSILVHDAKLRGDNEAIGKLAGLMGENDIRNAYATTDIISAISQIHRAEYWKSSIQDKASLPTSFSRILPIYMDLFTAQPLAQIIPGFADSFPLYMQRKPTDIGYDATTAEISQAVPDTDSDAEGSGQQALSDSQEPDQSLLQPSSVTLNVMLQSYCESCESLREHQKLLELYDHLKSLATQRHPVAASLLSDEHFYNFLLSALGSSWAPLRECLRLIGDMQDPYLHASSKAGVESSSHRKSVDPEENRDSFQPPQPNVHTWTSMLHIFMHRRQPRAAEKVLQIMQEKGLTPNYATWNALVMGYMRLQDPTMTADALNRTKKSGHSIKDIMSSRWWLKFKPRHLLAEYLEATSTSEDATESVEAAEPQAKEDEGDFDATVANVMIAGTGDIYTITKRRSIIANSPVYPNWLFDATVRMAEKEILSQDAGDVTKADIMPGDNAGLSLESDAGRKETSQIPVNRLMVRMPSEINDENPGL